MGRSKGLLLMWNSDINLQVILINAHCLNCLVFEANNSYSWQFIVVYGPPALFARPLFFDCLRVIGDAFMGSWMLVGDFNIVLNPCDKHGGRVVGSSSIGGLQGIVDDFGLIDMGFTGHPYTWSKRRRGKANIQERLDRGFANTP